MPISRKSTGKQLVLGYLTAVAVTFAAMLLISVGLIFLQISDRLLFILNQITKVLAVFLGTCAAVPRGGSRGFVTGVVVALFYACTGYALYAALGGNALSFPDMLGEMTVCAAVGAVVGAVRANLSPHSRSKAAV